MGKVITIGIDEVGRGALAGPVVLAAVTCWRRISWIHPELGRIRDSKRLTPRRRELWCRYLTAHPGIRWRVARVGPRVIDRINISQAANLAAARLVRSMANGSSSFVWLDGGLALPAKIRHRALEKGDERKAIIAAASIIAKVWRDRHMIRLAKHYPAYGFPAHKGYATRLHIARLLRRGPSSCHRQTFLRGLRTFAKYSNYIQR